MKEYRYERVIRCKCDLNKMGIKSLWDLQKKYPKLFDSRKANHFQIAPVEENGYLDYVLETRETKGYGEYSFPRRLSDNELEKYLPVFRQVHPDVRKDDLRACEYCWCNCCESLF